MVFGCKIPMTDSKHYQIYVDGSNINESVGYGVVIIKGGKVVDEFYGTVPADLVQRTQQIAGEIFAVRKAIEWCQKNSVNTVSISHDYDGIEKWATGEWQTKHPLTRQYADFIRKCGIKIAWHKVESHTGDRWNERADKLAKKGSVPLVQESDLKSELKNRTGGFVEFLKKNGYKSELKGIYNRNCAKIGVSKGDTDMGYVNIYYTKQDGISPRYHELKDESYKEEFESLWHEYHYGEKQLTFNFENNR